MFTFSHAILHLKETYNLEFFTTKYLTINLYTTPKVVLSNRATGLTQLMISANVVYGERDTALNFADLYHV